MYGRRFWVPEMAQAEAVVSWMITTLCDADSSLDFAVTGYGEFTMYLPLPGRSSVHVSLEIGDDAGIERS